MNYRRMGKSGLKISEISLGAWLTYGNAVEAETSAEIIRMAVERGINFIDIADIYARGEAERVVGRAAREMNRADLVISSKVFWPMSDGVNDRGLSRKHIFESIHRSLDRIGTDYLDIYYCHRFDPETEVEEVVRAMEDLIRQGKILYWGTSVWTAAQVERAVSDARTCGAYQPVVEQPRYNMMDRHIELDLLDTCRQYGIGLTVWSPLGQGLLTGKYNDGIPEGSRGATTHWLNAALTDDNLARVRKLSEFAAELGVTLAQMALAWVLRLPEISSAIIGATTVDQLEENIKGAAIALDEDELERIDEILGDTRTATDW
jgi:voltage-dependent potassium channel beta subunit